MMKEYNYFKFIIFLMILNVLVVVFCFSHLCSADEIITGHYCYTYGDNESLKEAREITRNLAVRNAIESYRAFVRSIGEVHNFQLKNDIIQILSTGYLKNIKTIQHTEKERTICETIQCHVSPEEIEQAIKREIEKKIKTRAQQNNKVSLDNGYIKIVRTQKDEKANSVDVYVSLVNPSPFLAEEDNYIIRVTFFDDKGITVRSEEKSIVYRDESRDEFRFIDGMQFEGDTCVLKFFFPHVKGMKVKSWSVNLPYFEEVDAEKIREEQIRDYQYFLRY